ncbi:MAG TPA: hypothetical protein VI136_23390 [Verrucomicrobiae bacterium]
MKTASLLTTLALVLPFAGTVFAGSYSWNAGTGYWTNAANWLPVGVPTETDTVIVGTGRVYLPTDPTLALDDFHLHGGEIRGTFDVRGLCEWTNGVIALGTNTVRTNAVLRLVGDATKTFAAVILNNEGWVAWANDGRIDPQGNCEINNHSGGIFEARGDGSVYKTSAGVSSFNNYGLFRKTGGTNSTWFTSVPFNNSGAVEIQTGTLRLNSGGTLSGSLVAWPDSQIELAGGNFLLDGEVTAIRVKVSGGTVKGTNALHGQVNWTSGGFSSGVTTVATNGTLRLWDDTEKFLSSHGLNNEGWLVWSNNCRLTPAGNCLMSNLPSGTFEVQGDGSIDRSGSAGSCTFHNLGTFRKSGGTGQTRIVAVPFVNSGATEVLTGALVLSSGGSLGGAIIATNGAEVLLTGGTFALGDELTAVNLRLAGGTIGGIGTLHGQVDWTSGNLSSGATTVATNCTLRLWDDTEKFLLSHGLNNEGWLVWSNNCRFTPAGTGVISNFPSGTFEVWGDGSIDRSGYAGSCTFYNLGTFRKSGGTGQTRIVALPFVNSGTVEVQTGALVLSNGGVLGGTIVATNGAEVLLTGGTFALGGDVTAVNLKLAGGAIGGTGTLHGLVDWTSGTLLGGVTTVATNCTLRLWDDTEKSLASHVLNNEGWLIWSNSCRLTPAGTCVISNQPGGTFEVWGDGSIDRSGYAGSCTFHNLGTFRKRGGAGQTRVTALPFINQGHVEARVGTLRFDTGYTQTSGTTWLAGGGVSAATPLDIQGGSVTGSGDIAASLKNGGLVSPGNSVGQINVLTDYTQTAAGTLRIEIAGRNPGQFDQVNVSGSAALDGTLTVTLTNGFTPAPGDTFPILTCSSRTGSFAVTNGLALGNGTSLAVEYRADGVFLVATGQVAGVTIASPTVSGTNFGFSLSTIADKTYTIQATEAIGSGDWTNVMTIIGDGTVQEALLPLLMHSQRFYRVRVSD